MTCCTTLDKFLSDEASELLAVCEGYADGAINAQQLTRARQIAKAPAMANSPDVIHMRDERSQSALRAAVLTAWGKGADAHIAVFDVLYEVLYSRRRRGFTDPAKTFYLLPKGNFGHPFLLARLFKDIFGNPFRDVTLNPTWLTPSVVALANGIYSAKDFDPMPILADALQDSGCDNEEILNHCRQPEEHVRGCWVVDLLLGKS